MFENGRKTIGMFVCKATEYFQRIFCKEMAQQAEQCDYNLIIFSTFGEYDNNREYITGECNMLEIPCYEKLDAVVLLLDTFDIPGMEERLLNQLKKRITCPVISIRKKQEGCINIFSHDKEEVSRMVEHMIDVHQAKKIYYLSGPAHMHDIVSREEGFRETVVRRGLDFDESYIYPGNLWYDVGERAVDYFLSLPGTLPDAILCANDYMAVSVCGELNRRNIRVPEDIRIAGFDDVVEAREIYPQITTVQVRPEDFAARAMEVIQQYDRGERLSEVYWVGSQNQYRSSCGCGLSDGNLVTMFRQLLENNRRLIHLGKQNTFMVFRMESITRYEELPVLIDRFIEGNEGVQNFFICLNEGDRYENQKDEGNPFTDDMVLTIHAYYNDAHVIQVDMPKEVFDRRQLLPVSCQKDAPQIYYANPMHYKEHCFGYALIAFKHHQFCECGDFYQSFIVNLSSVLQTIWLQEHIKQLNEAKFHLMRYERETDIYNKYGFMEVMSEWLGSAYEKKYSLAVLCVKIINLQQLMECYGWLEKDVVVAGVVTAIRKVIAGQSENIIGRIGENELYIVGKNQTKEELRETERQIIVAVNQMNLEWDKDYLVEIITGGQVQKMKELLGVEECLRRVQVKMNQQFLAKNNTRKYSNEAVQFIRHNYYRNLSAQEIADNIGITRGYLSSCFKEVFQLSVQEYIIEYRMKKAREMLLNSDLKIKEVAFYTGYQDELYFSKVFKKKYGVSPRVFRQGYDPVKEKSTLP